MLQWYYVASMLGAGYVMGIGFDVYDSWVSASALGRRIRPVMDVLFWILCAMAVFRLILQTDHGKFRLYTYLLLTLGYIVYRSTLRTRVLTGMAVVVRVLTAVVRGIIHLLDVVLIRPVLSLLWAGRKAVQGVYHLMRVLENAVWWLPSLLWKFAFERLTRRVPASTRQRLHAGWEGIWDRASKWIRGKLNES